MFKLTRKIFAVAMIAAMLALAACGSAPTPPADTTPTASDTTPTPPDTITAAPDTTTEAPVTSPVPTEDPLREQKAEIKQKVLAIMAEDTKKNPLSLFEDFCGDYSIPYLSKHNDFGVSANRIWQKDGVTAIEYANGNIEYTLVIDGYQFKLLSTGGNVEVTSVGQVAAGVNYVPSIFGDLSIDISTLYSGAQESDLKDPELTEEMLTVSDDLAGCTFSEEYMAAVIDMFLTEFGYTDAEKSAVAAQCSGSGVYSAEDNAVTFVLKVKQKVLGDVTLTVCHTDNERDGYSLSTKMEYTVVSEGINIPTSNETILRDIKYEGDEPQSVSVEVRVLETGATIVVDGVTCTVDTATISNYYVNKKDQTVNVDIRQDTNTVVAGQSIPTSAHIHLMINNRATLLYTAAQNSLQYAEIMADGVSFTAPADAVVPQIVIELAQKAYYNIVQ